MNETEKYPEIRELDGVYFRVERDGRWQNICFTDLTEKERDEVLKGQTTEWLASLCRRLADVVRELGGTFGIERS